MEPMNKDSQRTEQDALGTRELPAGALYGIHTLRAIENFDMAGRPVRPELIHAFGTVKQACIQTAHDLGYGNANTHEAMITACKEMRQGLLDAHILVDALQGGAGTSTNMAVNEVLTNRALQILGHTPGTYSVLHPIEDFNRFQSTNDTYPTAMRVAAITGIKILERSVIALQEAFEDREKDFGNVVKVGRTELQDAVLTTMGRTMSAFAEAFSRDRWRLYKCEERLRVVNLGGTAIGTGLGAPRAYIFRVTEVLRSLTGFGLARAENLVEATQNVDAFVEVSGILKTCAVNLLKVAGDLRLMSSGPDAGLGELRLPALQAGSSIMPGKVNPVMPEAVSQAAMRAMANDQALTQAAALGNLELNAFMPLIAECLLENIHLLTKACGGLSIRCVRGMAVNAERCARHVESSVATATALVEPLGYRQAGALLEESRTTGLPIATIIERQGLMTHDAFTALVAPENVMRLGSVPGGTGSTPSAPLPVPGGTGSTPSAPLPRANVTTPLSSAARVASGPPKLPSRRHPVHLPNVERKNQPVILFVTVCTHERQPLLANRDFHQMLIRAWQQADHWSVGHYLIMPDHIHLFCSPASIDAGNVNQWSAYWKGLLTRARDGFGPLALNNPEASLRLSSAARVASGPPGAEPGGTGSTPSAEHKPSGSLWQRDCWDTQLRDARHYAEKWAYVALNPVRKGLVIAPAEWPYQGEMNVLPW